MADATPVPIARFPFAMVLTSYFLQGALFLFLSGPLVILITSKYTPHIASMADLFKLGYPFVFDVLQNVKAEALSVSLIVIACFVAGTLSTIMDRAMTFMICAPLNFFATIRKSEVARQNIPFFTSREMADAQYPRFLSWLMHHDRMQAHWEWELFQYYLRWTLVTQVGLFFAFSWFLIPGWSWGLPIILSLSVPLCWFVLVFVAMEGSRVMRRVHCFYLDTLDTGPVAKY